MASLMLLFCMSSNMKTRSENEFCELLVYYLRNVYVNVIERKISILKLKKKADKK